jgi:hypothetical protein
MPPNKPTTSTRSRMARTAVLTATILAAISFPLGNVTRTGAVQAPTSEPALLVKSAIDGILDLFKQKQVVALGDFHGVAQEEAFYSALVRDPRFAEEVGNVVVEFGGSAAQGIIDRYVNGEDVSFTELRHVWTDVVGWLPGPFALGFVNFYANVRAAILKLPREHRIKVWLGDPKIDWTKISSFKDLQPILARRDDNISGIIVDEILKRQKKTLLIIGTGHLVGSESGSGTIPDKLAEANPSALAVISPFTGYIEADCNAKVVARAKDWPVHAVVGPIEGTWLKSELLLPGCNYIPPEQVERIKKQFAAGPPPGAHGVAPGKIPSADDDIIAWQVNMRSGVKSDAILYLGPPDTLTESPIEPSFYLDPDYFKEMSRRAQCCVPRSYRLDWDQDVRQNSVVPRKFQPR